MLVRTVLVAVVLCILSLTWVFLPRIREFPDMPVNNNERMVHFLRIPRSQPGTDVGFSFSVTPVGQVFASGGPRTPAGGIYSFAESSGQWQYIDTGEGGLTLTTVYVTDTLNAWVISNSIILRSRNGGTTWERFRLPEIAGITRLEGVTKSASDTVFIGGTTGGVDKTKIEASKGIEILALRPGGRDFKVAYRSQAFSHISQAISLRNGSTLFIVDGNKLAFTNDDGLSWKLVEIPFSIGSVATDRKNRLWSVDHAGRVMISADNGRTWEQELLNHQGAEKVTWKSIAVNEDGVVLVVGDSGQIAFKLGDNPWSHETINPLRENLSDVVSNGRAFAVQASESFYVAVFPESNSGQH